MRPAKYLLMRPAGKLLTWRPTQRIISTMAAEYLRLVWKTSRFTIEPSDAYERGGAHQPAILAMWHGQHLLSPFIQRKGDAAKALISHHRDGEINALVANYLGIDVIRGSGDHGGHQFAKGGAAALVAMTRALGEGYNIALTADVPKVARVVGRGVVRLARASGRPILPIAITTNWRIVLRNWDRTTLSLPFSRGACVMGEPIYVARDADEQRQEAAREGVQRSLDAITARAEVLVRQRTPTNAP
jgi:lysophospholipid acyltransferase (LPLAT)-like uncharacterized protein